MATLLTRITRICEFCWSFVPGSDGAVSCRPTHLGPTCSLSRSLRKLLHCPQCLARSVRWSQVSDCSPEAVQTLSRDRCRWDASELTRAVGVLFGLQSVQCPRASCGVVRREQARRRFDVDGWDKLGKNRGICLDW